MKRSFLLLVAAVALVAAGWGGPTSNQRGGENAALAGPLAAAERGSIADVTGEALPSVVNVSSTRVVQSDRTPLSRDPFFRDRSGRGDRKRYGRSLGSGVIVSEEGYILTNNHVVSRAREIQVSLSDGREFEAELVGSDPKSDLAVLKLQGDASGLEPIPFGESGKLRLGDVVLAIGNPFGVGQTVTMGIVSAKGRANMGIVDYEDFIQTDAAINPGNSGGALVNMKGELVGINTAILSRTGGYQGVGFAIPTHLAKPIMQSLIDDGSVERGWLGVQIQSLTRELADGLGVGETRGVLISDVFEGSPAERAGLRRGDVVLSIGGERVKKVAALRNSVAGAGAGAEVELVVLRGGGRERIRIELGELPDER